ncbi:hypothetical protein ABBQ38_003230 [Trebouxia sp. C0009 RCD-2024]
MPQVDQCTVNEYPAGVGLAPHIDTHSAFSGTIASLSLAGPAVIEFRRTGESHALLLPPRSLLVMAGPARYCWQHYIPHRKADQVQGTLLPRATCRMSFTFRQVRGYPCSCQWPEQCDSQQSSLPPTRMAQRADHPQPSALALSHDIDGTVQLHQARTGLQQSANASHTSLNSLQSAPDCRPGQLLQPAAAAQSEAGTAQTKPLETMHDQQQLEGSQNGSGQNGSGHHGEADLQRLEQEFVHDVYNAIAPHFSATRFAIWPKVRQFIEGLAAGSLVADVGCGNGKYFLVRQDIAVLGSDRSSGLAQVAATRLAAGTGAASGSSFKADVAVADGMCLPYASNRFDAVLSIAVVHHITTPSRRIHMLTELLRMLRPGGKALVTVWATHQEDMKKLAKWQPIDRPGSLQQSHALGSAHHVNEMSGALGSGGAEAQPEAVNSSQAVATVSQQQQDHASYEQSDGPKPGGVSQGDGTSNDYFVPWHLPFHRAEAALQVLKAEQEHDTAAAGSIRIDNKKNAVVFSRYYHVYEQFELDQLVQSVPGAEVLDSFYDKDNWCVVMGKRT